MAIYLVAHDDSITNKQRIFFAFVVFRAVVFQIRNANADLENHALEVRDQDHY